MREQESLSYSLESRCVSLVSAHWFVVNCSLWHVVSRTEAEKQLPNCDPFYGTATKCMWKDDWCSCWLSAWLSSPFV